MVHLVSAVIVASEGAAAEAATQPDNPILPVVAEFFWAGLLFMLLWALMKWVLLPPVQRTMAARDAKVRDDLAAAEAARDQASTSLTEYESLLATTRAEASRIVDDARARAEDARKQTIAAAEAEVAAQRAAAAAEVAAAKADALGELRPAVTSIAVAAAQAVVAKPLDEAAQRAIVEDYLSRSGSQN